MKNKTYSHIKNRIMILVILLILLFFQIRMGQQSGSLFNSSAILIEGPEHLTITGTNVNGFFGGIISNLGDFNGDEFVDYAITVGTIGLSKIYIFFGKNQTGNSLFMNDANITFVEENANDFSTVGLGIVTPKITGVEDVNNDGFDDFIVGAKQYDNGTESNAGIVYLILGSNISWGLDVSLSNANASFIGESANDLLGDSISGIGDTNGDSYDDFILGSSSYDNNGTTTQLGKSYLFYGRDSMDWSFGESVLNANASFIGLQGGGRSGIAVSGIGDVNKDGLTDFSIGTEGHTEYGVIAVGRVDIFYGNFNNKWKTNQSVYLSNASIIGEFDSQETSDFGSNLVGPLDFNNDGFDDFIIAATQYSLDTDGFEGKIYLISGAKSSVWTQLMNVSEIVNFSITGEYEEELGTILATLDDVNNDTFDDFIIGLPDYIPTGSDSFNPNGKAHLFFGSKNMNRSISMNSDRANMTFVGIAGERLGFSVQGIGDYNSDGYNNIALSAPTYGFSEEGRVYVVIGDLNSRKTQYITETSFQPFTQTVTESFTSIEISTEIYIEYSNITQIDDPDKIEFNIIWISIIAILIIMSAIGIYFRSALLQKVRKE